MSKEQGLATAPAGRNSGQLWLNPQPQPQKQPERKNDAKGRQGTKIRIVEQGSGIIGLPRALSEPNFNKPDIRLAKQGKDIVPPLLKAMDYWQASQLFDTFDIRKKSTLNRVQWFRLICAVCRDIQLMTKCQTDYMFDIVDLDGNGTIDKEEFLSWAFQTNSNYCTNMRKRLHDMDPRKVHEFFHAHDRDKNGVVDPEEFCELIETLCPESSLTHKALKELFAFIDVDNSKYIDANEFLDWVHPWRHIDHTKVSKLQAKHMEEEKAMLFEMQPKTPVSLVFTIGYDFDATLTAIKAELRKVYDRNQIQIVAEYDGNVKRCARLVAMVGRGIVLWNRATMLPYIDDPFHSVSQARIWILRVLKDKLPDLIGATNIRHLQKERFRHRMGAEF